LKKIDAIKINNKLQSEQLFKISPFKQVIKRTKPHKHDAYVEIIYLSEGAGFHWVDTQKFQINPPVVFFLSGQLHYWEMTAIPKGFVMLFKEDIVTHGNLLSLVTNLIQAPGARRVSKNKLDQALIWNIHQKRNTPARCTRR